MKTEAEISVMPLLVRDFWQTTRSWGRGSFSVPLEGTNPMLQSWTSGVYNWETIHFC